MCDLEEIVHALDDPDRLTRAADRLARKLERYRLRAADHAALGEALLWTLQQGLGATFTPEVRHAWVDAYGLVSTRMSRVAHGGYPPMGA